MNKDVLIRIAILISISIPAYLAFNTDSKLKLFGFILAILVLLLLGLYPYKKKYEEAVKKNNSKLNNNKEL